MLKNQHAGERTARQIVGTVPSLPVARLPPGGSLGIPKILSTGATLVCYTAVFSVVTQRSSPGGALRDDTKNGCVAD